MILLVVIFCVAFILVPLVDLTLNERVRVPVKVILYALTTCWILYVVITSKVV